MDDNLARTTVIQHDDQTEETGMDDMTVEATARPFGDWLREQRGGDAHNDLSDALNELVQDVVETGKSGSLTLKVTVKPAGKHGRTVFVSDEVKVSAPQHPKDEALYFVTPGGNLSRNNPEQAHLPLVEVARAPLAAGEQA